MDNYGKNHQSNDIKHKNRVQNVAPTLNFVIFVWCINKTNECESMSMTTLEHFVKSEVGWIISIVQSEWSG